ncbi:ribonuclease H-like domain-containing protein [Tanacetum coccineum]
MHNNIMAAGSKERPPMLGPGRYSQWHSRFLRYLDTKSNGEYLRKCIFDRLCSNGKFGRMLRTINNLIRTLLFQAHIPPSYWVEALNMAAHLLNRLPSTAINNEIPFTKLYMVWGCILLNAHFGCLCYPHVDASHKLEPRSTPCIFLGYPANHRGYRCLDLASNKIIISRHVRFDEDVFPFGNVTPSNTPTYDFLLPHIQTTTNVPTTEPFARYPSLL